jgi:hypothetical protein
MLKADVASGNTRVACPSATTLLLGNGVGAAASLGLRQAFRNEVRRHPRTAIVRQVSRQGRYRAQDVRLGASRAGCSGVRSRVKSSRSTRADWVSENGALLMGLRSYPGRQ